MKPPVILAVLGGLALAACGRQSQGLFADRSIPIVAPPAAAGALPRFVGRWAASAAQCDDPWVLEARSLSRGEVNCEFGKVDSSSAGYSVTSVCRADGRPRPGRLLITAPDPARMSSVTLSGGPFRYPVALQRCPSRPD